LSRHEHRQAALKPVIEMVRDIRRFMPRLGTRKLYHLLRPKLVAQGIKLGRDSFFALLRDHKMLIEPKKRYTKTTFSKHWMRKHPNLYAGMTLERPDEAYVSDITYVESQEGVHYLSLVTDAFSRRIVGHHLSKDMSAAEVVKALIKATSQRTSNKPLVHHSDRGLQYCSGIYQSELQRHDIKPSMTDGYDCYQNALAERMNGILKQEFLLGEYPTFEILEQIIDESILIYNEYRPHLSLGLKTPNEVHKKAAPEGAAL
jgi:transposase InsO family protein